MKTLVQHSSRSSLCLLTLFVPCILLFSNASAQELLRNSSFEQPASVILPPDHMDREETLQVQHWQSYAGATLSDEKSRTGESSAKFRFDSDAQGEDGINFHLVTFVDRSQILPGSILKASCWVLNEELLIPSGNRAVFFIDLVSPDGVEKWVNTPLPSPSGEWEQIEAELEVPQEFDGSWTVRVGAKIVAPPGTDLGSGVIYFDDFEAEILE